MVDAPSLSTSTRPIIACGIVLRSTAPTSLLEPMKLPTWRRPLMSTSVRLGPSPRRLTALRPMLPLLVETPY